ncbi:MAG: hypothetical protein J07HB67_00594 [halophilic archaeon J07HB67]|nr:MAG: hypothetical protein J07HB67_00594 [halophilic archaeon J07HB67]
MTAETTLAAAARREIEALHDFFGAWFRGDLDHEAFGRPVETLGPSFRMVRPDGRELAREAVIDGVRSGHASEPDDPPFEILVRDQRVQWTSDDRCLVRYEEWQRSAGRWRGRRSTAAFVRDRSAPAGVVWSDLHETWIDGEDPPNPE